MNRHSILVTGACGQVGLALVSALQVRYGHEAVWASDKRPWSALGSKAQFFLLDVMDAAAIKDALRAHHISTVYHLASLLSAQGEKHPRLAWQLSTEGLFNVLEAARSIKPIRVFFPSSIAVCGPNSQRTYWPQYGYNDPQTIYGIAKLAGEQLLAYYHSKYHLDGRSLRYPGLIGGTPGGGTTDYACEMYQAANNNKAYKCFLAPNTKLPLMDIQDAIQGTIQYMEAPAKDLSVRTSYNIHAFACTPKDIENAIQTHKPKFKVQYHPDHRNNIALTWPTSIDDTIAKTDWGWCPQTNLNDLTRQMLNIETPKS